jgi:hypothetical protein
MIIPVLYCSIKISHSTISDDTQVLEFLIKEILSFLIDLIRLYFAQSNEGHSIHHYNILEVHISHYILSYVNGIS